MLKTAISHSLELDSSDAIEEVLGHCHEQLGDLKPQAGILFTGIDHDFTLILDRINEIYPGIELIGCTTDGELTSVHGFAEDSITLMLLYSDKLFFKAGAADGISKDTAAIINKAVVSVTLQLDQEPVLCITTPSGLTASGDLIVEGLQKSLGENFPVFGGTAGDQLRMKCTYQFYNKKVFTDAAPFLLISGPILYSFGIETGKIPIGKKAVVTRSDNNIVYKIGENNALEFYKYYLGDKIGFDDGSIISDYPLAVFEEDNRSFYLRGPVFEAGSENLRFFGNVPQGSTIQLTHSTRDNIVDAAKISVNSSLTGYPGTKPSAALCFSCAARKFVLGTRVKEEYNAFKTDFPDVPVIGFYTYGEIGPLTKDKPVRFHNETFISLLIGVE